MTRSFVVGLDGASWKLITPWLESGDLPNIRELRETGSWARSRSCLPPVTFPNWKCYSASKNPGNLGVYWFERIDLANERIEIPDRRSFKTAELWDYLNDAGLTAGIVNMPTMYPPRAIDGAVVCGGPDAVEGEYRSIDSGYTYPSELEARLEERFDYQVHPDPLISSNEETGEEVEAILRLLEKRFEVAVYLFEEEGLDFVHVTLFYLNVLQHFFWDGEPTKRAWELIDDWLGRIAALDDTDLIVMSDHGCAPTTTEFYINEWLAQQGYLHKRRTIDDLFQRVGLTRETMLGLAKQLGIVDFLAAVVPESLQKLVPQEAGVKRERKLEMIDVSRTKALASGQGPVYVNPDFDVDSVVDDVIRELETVSDEEGPLFDGVYRADEIYHGSFLDIGPDIVIDQRPGVTINDGMGGETVQATPTKWRAENSPSGVFIANGPSFDDQGRLSDISILDIAPTILAALDIAIPTDMEGDILPLFGSDDCASHETRSPISLDDRGDQRHAEEVQSRLKQLGYME